MLEWGPCALGSARRRATVSAPDPMISYRRCRICHANFVLDWLDKCRARRQSRQAHHAGNLGSLAPLRDDAPRFRARRHRRPGASMRCCIASSARHRQFRAERRPVDPRSGRVVETNVVGTFTLLERRAPTRRRCRRPSARFSLSPCVDRRGLRLVRSRGTRIHRIDAVRAEQPVLGIEGGRRSSGAHHHTYGLPR